MILCIETATDQSSVAIFNDGELIGNTELHLKKSHSAYLTVMINDLLKNSGLERSDLAAVAVSIGPGSYTGLRIGLSTAKGICYSLSIPLLSISTLDIMFEQVITYFQNVHKDEFLFCPMIDARRMEVYTALYNTKKQRLLSPQAMVIDGASFKDFTEHRTCALFGNGASKCLEVLPKDDFILVPEVYPSAKYMGALAQELYNKREFADLAYIEPLYVKAYQAKLPKKNKLLG